MASKLYRINATTVIFVFVLYFIFGMRESEESKVKPKL